MASGGVLVFTFKDRLSLFLLLFLSLRHMRSGACGLCVLVLCDYSVIVLILCVVCFVSYCVALCRV